MSGVKKVLIHQIKQSMTNLEDTLEHFRPDYVFLLSCKFYARDKPALAVMDSNSHSIPTGQSDPFEWDQNKMKDMKRSELWVIFREWSELTWSNNYGYQLDLMHTEIAA